MAIKFQLVELGTATIRAIEGLRPADQPTWYVKDFLFSLSSSLIGAFSGAFFAFRFEESRREREARVRVAGRLRLILEDLKKAKRFLKDNKEKIDAGLLGQGFGLYAMPETYFQGIDFVELLQFVSKECVDHIRNISQYVFANWKSAVERGLDPALLRQLAVNTEVNCDKVIDAIETELKRLS